MTEPTCDPIEVRRTIEAPASEIFEILRTPSMHPRFDGTGMVRSAVTDARIERVGDIFTMQMHNGEFGDYQMNNLVVAFEPGRRIAWEPAAGNGHPNGNPDDPVGTRAHHVWGYELAEAADGSTTVTEVFDCSKAPEQLRRVLRDGERWRAEMGESLEQLAALCEPAPRGTGAP